MNNDLWKTFAAKPKKSEKFLAELHKVIHDGGKNAEAAVKRLSRADSSLILAAYQAAHGQAPAETLADGAKARRQARRQGEQQRAAPTAPTGDELFASDVAETIAGDLNARDLGSLASTSKATNKQFGNVLDRMLWRALGKPKVTTGCGDAVIQMIMDSGASQRKYFTALRKYEESNFSYVHEVWLKANKQVRSAYKKYAASNELGPALPAPTPDNVLDVLRRRFPAWRFRLDTPDDIRTTGQTLARLDWQKELDDSLRTAIDGFLKVNAEVASTMYGSSVDELSVNWGRKAVRLRSSPPKKEEPLDALRTKFRTTFNSKDSDWHHTNAGELFWKELTEACKWNPAKYISHRDLHDEYKDDKANKLRRVAAKQLVEWLKTKEKSTILFVKDDTALKVRLAKLRQCVRDEIDKQYADDPKKRDKLRKLFKN
jgi:hypothetical protein